MAVVDHMEGAFESLGLDRVWRQECSLPPTSQITRYELIVHGDDLDGKGAKRLVLPGVHPARSSPLEGELLWVGTETDGQDVEGKVAVFQTRSCGAVGGHTGFPAMSQLSEAGAAGAIVILLPRWRTSRSTAVCREHPTARRQLDTALEA